MQEWFEFSFLDRFGDDVFAQTQNARALNCQAEQHGRTVGTHRSVDLYLHQLAIHSKWPSCRTWVAAQIQACMICEVGRLGWAPMARELAWAGTNNSRYIDDLAGNERRVV